MHAKPARRFRYIAPALFIDALDMLPADAVCAHRVLWRCRHALAGVPQRRGDAVRVGRFRQVIQRPCLHSGNRRGDIAKAGQHDNLAFGTFGAELGYEAEAASVLELHVEDGIGRCRLANAIYAFGDGTCVRHLEAARFHCAPEPGTQRRVIVQYK